MESDRALFDRAICVHDPLELILVRTGGHDALRVTLHQWKPEGGPYEGLPEDLSHARIRSQQRFAALALSGGLEADTREPPRRAVSDCCLDLRML